MSTVNIDEIKEEVIASYSRTFDKDMAYDKVGISDKMRTTLEQDKEFQQRMKYFLIVEREKIIQNLRTFMDSDDEKISFKATTDMAQFLYPDFFEAIGKGKRNPEVNVHIHNTPEEDERIANEYGELLGDPAHFMTPQ